MFFATKFTNFVQILNFLANSNYTSMILQLIIGNGSIICRLQLMKN
jgi:hypothetical protein